MDIDPKESDYFFQNHLNRELSFSPEGLDDIVIEWCSNVVDGEVNVVTRQDSRKWEHRIRAVRVHKNVQGSIWKTNILMDTGKYVKAHVAHKEVDKFIKAQLELEESRR